MHADNWFTIGRPHVSAGSPCEDYALSGRIRDTWFGCISDGCGGAYAHTDVGARSLAFAFQKALSNPLFAGLGSAFLDDLSRTFDQTQISDDFHDNLATLVGWVATAETFQVMMLGDGVVAAKNKDGSLRSWTGTWVGNAPLYLTYLQNPDELRRYRDCFHQFCSAPFQVQTDDWDAQGVLFSSTIETFSWDQIKTGWTMAVTRQDSPTVEAWAVYSDGVLEVGKKSLGSILKETLAFKNTEGSFVKRRMIRAATQWHKDGLDFQDDFSMAACWWNLDD